MWAIMRLTLGAFSICMEMCGNGPRTGTKRPTPSATRWWTQTDRHPARIGCGGVVPGATTGRTRGAFLICTETCLSGPRTGIRRLIPPATQWWIPPDRPRARIGSVGVVPGATTGRPCVQLRASTTPPAPVSTLSASVLVSKIASNKEARKVLA